MTKKNNNSNNGWKRIAAGALSMALVAGALPANVGGFLTIGQGIVASAGNDGIAIDYDANAIVPVADIIVNDTFADGTTIAIPNDAGYNFHFDDGTADGFDAVLDPGAVYHMTGAYKCVGNQNNTIYFQIIATESVVATPTDYASDAIVDPANVIVNDTFANGATISVPAESEDAYTIIVDGAEEGTTLNADNPSFAVTFDGNYADKFVYKCVGVNTENKTINLETVDTRIVPTVNIGAITGLVENGNNEQQLVEFTNDGGENGYGAIHFRLGEEGQWTEDVGGIDDMKASAAGTYTVYWYTEETDDLQGIGSRDEPKSVEVTIAAKYSINNLTLGDILPAGTVITAANGYRLYLDNTQTTIGQGYTLQHDTVVGRRSWANNIINTYLVSITDQHPFVESTQNFGTFTSNNGNNTAAYSEFKINVKDGQPEDISWSISHGNTNARLYILVDGEPTNIYNIASTNSSGTIRLMDAGTHIIKVVYAIAYNGVVTNNPYVTISNSKLRFKDAATYEVEAAELKYTGEDQELVTVQGEGGNIWYRYKESTDTAYGTWSKDIPKATDIGNYDVQWYCEGNEEYAGLGNAANGRDTVQAEIGVGKANINFETIDGNDPLAAYILDADNNPINPGENDIYNLDCNNTYYVYSNETLNTNITTGLTIATTTINKEVEGVNYHYKYTVTLDKSIPDGTSIIFAHKHATDAFNQDNEHTTTNQVWVKCSGEPSSKAECIAELITEDVYYYGTSPVKADIKFKEYFGAEATVSDKNFYFTLKGDEGATRLQASQLEVGNDYTVHAIVAVMIEEKITYVAIEKDISYQAMPLNMCEIYVKNGNDYDPVGYKPIYNEEQEIVDYDKSTVVIPNIFTYNSFTQSPVIAVKNNVLGTLTVLTKNDYTNQITPQTNAGDYSGTLVAVEKEGAKYSGTLNVEWSIAKADVRDLISVEPIFNADTDENGINDAITYDGQVLDINDFTVSAAEIADEDTAAEKARKTLAAKFVEEIEKEKKTDFSVAGTAASNFKTVGEQTGLATLTNPNYVDVTKNLELDISKRPVNITPDANQSMVFGDNDDPELTFTVEEENEKAHTGFVETDLGEEETAADFFDGVIKVGREIETTNVLNPNFDDDFDNEVFDNDAGTYEFALASVFDNYEPVLVGDAVFTVKPKEITSEDIEITLAPADEFGNKLEKQFIIGEDNIPSLDFNHSTQYVIVDSIKDKSIKDSNDALTKDVDFVVGGTTQKYLPGSFKVQVVGENNYTGIAYSPWQINALEGSDVIKLLATEDAEYGLLDGQKYYDGEDITELFEIDNVPGATIITSFYDEDKNKLDSAPTKAGKYTVRVTVKQDGYVERNEEEEVYILPRPVDVTAEAVKKTVIYSYGGPGVGEPTFEGILEDEEEDFLANASVKWTLDETNDLYFGEVITTDEYNNNYEFIVKDVEFEVVAKDIASADIRVFYPDKTKMSEGDWVTCSDITVIDVRNGRKLELGADYTLNGNTSQEPGEFTIEIVGKAPHYKDVKEVPWVVVAEDKDVISPRVLSYRTYGNNQIEFTVNNTYNGTSENVEYGVLLTNTSGVDAETMTLEDVDGKVIHNAPLKFKTSVFRAQDNGKGVSARPYMKVDGNVTYGKQVYVTFKELSVTKEASHSEIMSCSKEDEKGTLRFTANFNLGDDTDAKYGVLITNKNVDELTPENALVDHECKYTISSFTASANGENGITMRTYILKDGVYKFGPQVTYNYADYS